RKRGERCAIEQQTKSAGCSDHHRQCSRPDAVSRSVDGRRLPPHTWGAISPYPVGTRPRTVGAACLGRDVTVFGGSAPQNIGPVHVGRDVTVFGGSAPQDGGPPHVGRDV